MNEDDDLYAFDSVDPQPKPTCFCGGNHFTGWCLRDVKPEADQ